MRVSISAIGSVIRSPRLPARFGYAGYMAFERQVAEADAAQLKLSQISASTPAAAAPIMHPGHKNVQAHPVPPGPFAGLFSIAAVLLLQARLGICQSPFQLIGLVDRTCSRHVFLCL